jgi:outer membrane protein assembly factor BamA
MPDEPRLLPPSEPGSLFDSGILTEIVRDITGQSLRDGYPETRIRPVLSARGDTIDITLEIARGAQAVIDSFAVTGLTRTRDETVLRELAPLRNHAGDTQAVAEARNIIRALGFVTLSADPEIIYPPGQPATLALKLEEGPQGSFDGILGYQSDANGAGEMIGTVDISLRNLAGTARDAAVHWQNSGKGTGDMTVRYREPWLFNFPYAFEGAFSQQKRDRLAFTKTALQLSLNRAFGGIEAGGGYRYEKISADSLSSSSAHGIDLSVRWTTLDNMLNPRSGFRYRAAWTNLAKSYRFGSQKSHGIRQAEFDMEQFIPTFPGQALAFLFRYRKVTAPVSSLTAADRYWLGGATSIRGYREQVFPAVEAAWANVEYRFIQSDQSRVFIFVDYGHLIDRERTAGILKTTRLDRAGWGFGLRTAARVGTLGFDYALGQGDSWMNGKLHVSLSNSF